MDKDMFKIAKNDVINLSIKHTLEIAIRYIYDLTRNRRLTPEQFMILFNIVRITKP